MSDNNEPLQPTPFDVARPEPPQETEAATADRRGGAPGWVLPALGGLVLLALLVVFWLPEQVAPPAPEPAVSEEQAPTGNVAQGPATQPKREAPPDKSPWQDAQAAKLRKEAQDVLGELLEVQEALEERGVQRWGAEEFAAATALAEAGDELYKTRQYEEAKARYAEGLAALRTLEASIPEKLAALLAAATEAIEAGDIEAVENALATAAELEPDSPDLAVLRERAAVLPQLLPLLEQAAAAEQAGDLAAAEKLLQQATDLDPAHRSTADELQRVTAAHLDQRFNDAMSDGYTALDEARFQAAREAFRSAAKLQPGSQEAASALLEVETAETAYRLATLKKRGAGLEQQEKWEEAVKAYEQAQKIDASVLFAAEGLTRSRPRAKLDKQFSATLKQPERLSDVAVAEAVENLLRQARGISPRGPVLTGQIEQLDRLLDLANTPVRVTLRSDMETEVIVYKVARLGRFDQRELTLRPGTYTAVGTRRGFRDVRHEFKVGHEGAPPSLTIACTEPI